MGCVGPHPAVADVRRAVREALAGVEKGALVLAACSGGADSLALSAALAFVASRMGLRAGALTVDHGLQPGSAERAATVAEAARGMGLDPVEVLTVTVGTAGGPEAAARDARYAALTEAADRLRATAVLLGHTRDDQAETVLLGLARGSGPRSLSGMAASSGRHLRPFLGLSRATTVAACRALGLSPWDDPHNDDPRFTRVRVRRHVLPVLEKELGPGVAEALARTAGMAREDADALDGWADSAYRNCALSDIEGSVRLSVGELERLPDAVRRRVLRRAAIAAGAPPGALSAAHVLAVDRLVTRWHGQKAVDLPGGLSAVRRYGTLILAISPIP
ncbi:tRNA lysidine(34) synthetase TilS [Nonomuraea sp. KC401]|uniref:tRNA lysidine(34) synthetase TilS n=1 Tax=unclassified Nonomuraea TaxID=2593643 RepID=UPI0010FD5A56|nr:MULTISPECIES: tRNA lysidine(34) synthetase TilS [unclassified Nonomuraea]NBE96362.1 tRNA lysidine(34) synthetase TilS [Nonomuraea sp. K271]TLF68095.1 tRNA lysidine(34) synthetase TilS [Nonomuraea sp. KC401]